MTRREFYAIFSILFLLVTIALAGIGHFAGENRKRADEGKLAHDALCALKGNLERRVQGTEDFLARPAAEIPPLLRGAAIRALVQSGLNRDQDSVASLAGLSCSKAETGATSTKGKR